jgi:Lrp/AsnC family leucine-responsive transcriptional regulator
MDAIDRKILVALQQDGSAGLAELSKVAGLSVSATAERVKRLEERQVIRGWRADLDPAAVGCPLLAFVFVALRGGAKEEAAFRKAMRREEAVLECHQVSGVWTHLLKLRLPDLAALEGFLAGLRGQSAVDRTEVLVALATAKETAILPVAPAPPEEE